MVWKQILKDLRKEWTWAFFYTVVATMIAMAILYLSVSFSSVQRQSAAIRSFVRWNVVMFQMKPYRWSQTRRALRPQTDSRKIPMLFWIICSIACPQVERPAALSS